ncbi:serine hydrolase [Actinotalea sp. BY-33]|uniref:Serine hydrolase n=1 Tax=Actinotalea soli TaxID=2819234 RepID=A0A939RUI0_9CELL|nr:serine hydrolase [Actinotalea soli]MBO1751360.1 serine hydrolase [Actinotalea soli]
MTHRTTTTLRGVAVAVGLALLVGCTSTEPDPEPTDPAPTSTAEPEPGPEEVALPDHAAGRAAAWVMSLLDDEPGAPLPEAEERFAPEFLEELPVEALAEVIDQLRTFGPWTVTAVEGTESELVARIEGVQSFDLQLSLDEDELIQGLFFATPAPDREPAASWEELVEEVEDLPGSVSMLVARPADQGCVALDGGPAGPVGSAAGEQLPVGSVAKLYVLGAVVEAVEAGDLAWDTDLTLTDDLRSLPSGELQEEPAGTTVTVEAAAEAMISISDNTATDLLIDAVGREQVEAALTSMGHSDPAANTPFPSTRELFQLGWGGGAELRNQWRDAGTEERRALLEELPDGEIDIDVVEVTRATVWHRDVDWFATAEDLCLAHAALAELAGTEAGAPVRDILALNPGVVPADAGAPAYLAFKGGSVTGVMAGAWYAEDAEGDPVVVTLQSASRDPAGGLPVTTMVGIATDALRLALQDD